MTRSEEKLDRDEAVERLNAALCRQYRSALAYSVAAASMTGIPAIALSAQLRSFGDEEVEGIRVLVSKIVSFGGTPTDEVAELRIQVSVEETLRYLIECEGELIEYLKEAIEPTGREGRSEALEHILEHLIMRKQTQVDLLRRAVGS